MCVVLLCICLASESQSWGCTILPCKAYKVSCTILRSYSNVISSPCSADPVLILTVEPPTHWTPLLTDE